MWVLRLEAHAMTREAALETFERAWADALKTKFEDANGGPVIWGHLSRQSGLVFEDVPSELMRHIRAPGFPVTGARRQATPEERGVTPDPAAE